MFGSGHWRRSIALGACALLLGSVALGASQADVAATIRVNLAKRLPNLPRIDEIRPTPVAGLYELRIGSQVIYSDAQGRFVIEGEIIDAERHANLTRERVDALTAFDFSKLPLKDAVVWKQGTGARKLVVFADPNCGYCRQLERDLTQVRDITVFTFLVPILGGDSPDKARNIWCAKDSGKAWRSWMIDGVPPPAAAANCDTTALTRNVALSEKHAVTGTPSLVFENSERVPGIISPEEIEKKLAQARRKG